MKKSCDTRPQPEIKITAPSSVEEGIKYFLLFNEPAGLKNQVCAVTMYQMLLQAHPVTAQQCTQPNESLLTP